MFDLKGKKALVTGSSQGIGFAVAKTISEYGAKVFVHGSNKAKCENAAMKIKNSVSVTVDLGNKNASKELYGQTGDVDILILNASVQFRTPWNERALSDPDYSKLVLAGIPLGYAGEADDVSGAALLLCSDAGRYITGTDIIIDRGMSL